jgi:hypothetical protein
MECTIFNECRRNRIFFALNIYICMFVNFKYLFLHTDFITAVCEELNIHCVSVFPNTPFPISFRIS